jgi:hypothetical protein
MLLAIQAGPFKTLGLMGLAIMALPAAVVAWLIGWRCGWRRGQPVRETMAAERT